jgi:putative colanic acid biosynthesis acetyltransferase WcaF
VRLDIFNNSDFDRGRSWLTEALWRIVEGLLVGSWIPGSAWRATLLRLFGAGIGRGVVVKPHVRVKFPWKLTIGDHSWIGEGVWIDNLAEVTIGSHCCISQGAYLCTGSHRWDKETFDLETKPIVIGDECWVGAMAVVAPGCKMSKGAVVTMKSLATGSLEPCSIYSGVPAKRKQTRNRQNSEEAAS